MACSQLCSNVCNMTGQRLCGVNIRSPAGKLITIDVHEERGGGGEKRYVYVHNSLIVGAGAWYGYPECKLPSQFIGSTELVPGRSVSLFWVGASWVAAWGHNLTADASTIEAIDVETLGLDTKMCYALVQQDSGVHGLLHFQNALTYVVGGWDWTRDGLIARDLNLPSCTPRPKHYSAAEQEKALVSLNAMSPTSCVKMVCWTRNGGVEVRNAQLTYLATMQDKSRQLLVQQLLCQHGEMYVHSQEQARRYSKFVRAVWNAYMSCYVRKQRGKQDDVLRDVLRRLHKVYVSRIGTSYAITTKTTVNDMLMSFPVELVADYIRRWEVRRSLSLLR